MLNVCGGSVIGGSHVKKSMPNQDSYAIGNAGDTSICIVSDGAGSRKFSEFGSRMAADIGVAFLKERAESGFDFSDHDHFIAMSRELIALIKKAVKLKAAQQERELHDYAATFHAVVAEKNSLAYIHLGDGSLVFTNEAGEYQLACKPIKGEYINQTVFFTSDNAGQMLETFYLPYLPAFFSLATDGIENIALVYRDWSVHPPFFDHVRGFFRRDNPEEALKAFLSREEVEMRTDDDKTVIVAESIMEDDKMDDGGAGLA